ncbi:hypothetical protein EBME_0289 [bacterium endosymbiont of Mortierella elongata FMR23-6]|nr:hypothetical protein EBME_0289 [bacterium endosymbiont of Mortierella elongata FMR23-6]
MAALSIFYQKKKLYLLTLCNQCAARNVLAWLGRYIGYVV